MITVAVRRVFDIVYVAIQMHHFMAQRSAHSIEWSGEVFRGDSNFIINFALFNFCLAIFFVHVYVFDFGPRFGSKSAIERCGLRLAGGNGDNDRRKGRLEVMVV